MKRSYTYLKGLLTLALAAFTGWMWAADPVATWTDFNTLTSGNYTITKDAACTVNTDGSITLGGTGLTLEFSSAPDAVSVVMDISGAPEGETATALLDIVNESNRISSYTASSKLSQRYNGSLGTAGNGSSYREEVSWTPAKRQLLTVTYSKSNGLNSFLDGRQVLVCDGLKGSSFTVQSIKLPAAGMTVHSLRLYSTKLAVADVYAASYRSVISYCVNNNTSNDELSGLAIGEDAVTRVKNKHWNNISCSASGHAETANSYDLSSAQDNNGKIWPIGVSGTASGQWRHNQKASLGEKGNNYADGPWVMNFKDIPFTKYDVVLYMATDNGGHKWGAIQVGETNSTYYVPDSTDPTVATSTDVTASTQWGQSTPATAAYGTNVIRITDLTEKDLYLKTLKNTRGGLHGFQIINRGEIRKIKADAGTTVTYTANTEITFEVSGTGTLLADGCTLDMTKATMKGCALAAQNNGVIVLKADQLDTIGGLTIPQGATVKIVTDSTEAVILGKATFAVPTNTTIAGSVTLVTLDGEKVATAEIADGILTAKFTANPAVTGTAWWWDYEFDESKAVDLTPDDYGYTTSDPSIGSDKGTLTLEGGDTTPYTEVVDGNQALYFQKTPWRDATFSNVDAFTAVMYCQPGEYNEVPLVGFGSTTAGGANAVAIVLATGKNAANGEMAILLVKGSRHVVTPLADNLIVPNATTTNHLYAFTFDAQADQTVISVYVDGKLKKTTAINERFHVTNGFQIGSIHGGVMADATGLQKYPTTGNSGTLDFLRVAKGVLSADAMKELAKAYPYVSENGNALRTITDATANWVAAATWTQKVPNVADVAQAAPNAGTNVTLTANAVSEVTVNLDADATYEAMTVDGTAAVKFVVGAHKILAGDMTVETDTIIEYGAIEVGTLTVEAGKTLTFDFTKYAFDSVYASKTLSLTGLATLGADAEVTVILPSLPAYMTAEIVLDEGKGEYALVITVTGSISASIGADGDWDSITWKMGDVTIAQPDLNAFASIPLTVTADATLSMNKAVTLKNLTISGEGALTIAENGGNKLTVSGATTINTNVTATAGAAALGSITITDDNSLAIKEKIANVGTIASNAGELVYMGGNITEDKQLTNVIGAIRIASGTVNFTKANGDYTTGAITIDNGATMKVSEGQHNSFGNSPITNNGAIVSTGSGAHLYPVVSGTGTLTVESGTLTLHGANTYQGGTTVAGGTLVVSGADAGAKVLPEGKTVTVNANATIQLVAGLSFVTIEGEGKTLVTGTYTYGISNTFTNALETKTVEVAEGGVLQFRAWKAYALTIDSLTVNGTLKNDGYDGATAVTLTVAKDQKISGAGTNELATTLADGALVGNAAVVPANATVQGSVICDTAEIATALVAKLMPPDGYKYVVNENVVTIAKAGAFTVNGETYESFADAFANVAEGGTITIDETVAETAFETSGFVIEKSMTIDLGGKTLTLTPPAVGSTGTKTLGIQILKSAADVKIVNGTINVAESNLTAENPIKMMINNYASSSLTIENVTLDGSNLVKPTNAPAYTLSNNQGTVAIVGSTIIAKTEGGIAFDACKYANYEAPSVTVDEDSTITGSVELSGGSVTAAEDAITVVSGIAGYKVAYNGMTYTLEKKGAFEVNGTDYATLAEAYAVAGDSITLTADAEGPGLIINKAVTIDFGGHTYTLTDGVGNVPSNGLQILKEAGNVTLKNGTLKVADDAKAKFYILVQNYTNLTVTDMVLDGTNLDKWSGTDGDSYTLSINSGTVAVNGETKIIANDDGDLAYAFDSCKYQNYDAPAVTVADTVKVDGKVELSGGALTAPAGLTVTTSAGYKVVYADGEYTMVKKGAFEVNGTDYATLAEAYAVAGDSITLTADAEGPGLIINKAVTIDFGGHTYTLTDGVGNVPSNGLQILKEAGNVTLKNGTLKVADDAKAKFYILVQNYTNLTVTDMVLDGTNLDKWSGTDGDSYTLSINSGTVAVNGETKIIANDDGDLAYAFDSCKYQNYDAPAVTVADTVKVDGKVELSGGALTAPATLSVIAPEGYKAVCTDGVWTLVKLAVIPEALAGLPEATKAAIEAAMAEAGVTEITSYAVMTKGGNEDATVDAVADILTVFDVPLAVEDGELVVAYEFGISSVTNEGEVITITASVDEETTIRTGVTVVFTIGEATITTTSADGKTATITGRQAADINGKKITVKATK